MKSYLAALGLVGSVLMAASPAGAVVVANATDIRVTSALTGVIGDSYLQVGELLAYDFGNVDVALTGTPTALSQYSATAEPNKATDGVYPAAYDFGNGAAGIYHSLGTSSAEYLNILLQNPATLSRLTIYGRADCCQSRDFYNVSIFGANNTLLYSGQLDARTTGSATVTFDAPAAAGIPEPAAWALMIMGFGAAGSMLRRARGRPVTVTA